MYKVLKDLGSWYYKIKEWLEFIWRVCKEFWKVDLFKNSDIYLISRVIYDILLYINVE